MSLIEPIRFLIGESTRFVSPETIAAEWVLVALAAACVVIAPFRSHGSIQSLLRGFRQVANRRVLSIWICGLLPMAIRLSMLGFAPVPEPSIHDEFSHLLLADTFAHGRITNPTHPMWRHFESIHIIQQPTYTSMYPPVQGAFLALGQVLFRDPWAGVVISVGVMCAAMCWMMQGWLPPVWALVGTLIAVMKIGVVGFWMNSYVGGSAPAIGGALLIGSLPRLKRGPIRTLDAIFLGLGMVILMNTRPFEGALLALASIVYCWRAIPRIWIPAGAVFALGVAFTGYYCWRVTGSPIRMPYQVNRDTYGWPENLGFLPPKKVALQHPVLQEMYIKEIAHRDIYNNIWVFLDNLTTRVFDSWTYFLGPVLTIPLLLLPWIIRDREARPLIVFIALVAFLNLFQMLLYPYHLGPVVPILFAIVAHGVRRLYLFLGRAKPRRAWYFAAALPVCLILVGAMKQNAAELNLPLAYWERAYEPHRDARAYVQWWLSKRPGKQLVIVHYSENHSPDQEWVYNRADIDNSKVVWAREMNPASDAALVAYFKDREVWLLQADVLPQRVVHR